MDWYLIIVLLIIGFGMIFLEIFVLPGLIVGIIGGLITIFAIVQTYSTYGVTAGNMTLIFTLLAFIILLVLFFKPKTWKKLSLQDTIDIKVNTIDERIQPGVRGVTVSRLAPAGKALFFNTYYEVATYGEYVESNVEIEVVKIDGNKIYVRQVQPQNS